MSQAQVALIIAAFQSTKSNKDRSLSDNDVERQVRWTVQIAGWTRQSPPSHLSQTKITYCNTINETDISMKCNDISMKRTMTAINSYYYYYMHMHNVEYFFVTLIFIVTKILFYFRYICFSVGSCGIVENILNILLSSAGNKLYVVT